MIPLSVIRAKVWRSLPSILLGVGAFLSVMLGTAFYETGRLNGLGTWGIIISVFLAPSFILRLYLMWENRENIKQVYDMAETSFSVIKARNKENKRRGGKKNGFKN